MSETTKEKEDYEPLLSAQIQIIRGEINSLEQKISAFESDPTAPFNSTDVRYIRWVNEKILLQKNLHEILLGISTLTRDDPGPGQGSATGTAHVPAPESETDLQSKRMSLKSKGNQEFETDNIIVEADVEPDDSSNNKHNLQIKEYTQQKKNIKMIWRDFSNNRIHFKSVDTDARDIFISDYQIIVGAIKMIPKELDADGTPEPLEKHPEKMFILGEMKTYKTTINLKTKEFSYTDLFTPFYEKGGFTQVRKKKQI